MYKSDALPCQKFSLDYQVLCWLVACKALRKRKNTRFSAQIQPITLYYRI